MVIKLKEGYQDESFVAYYNGELFYTGQLDSNFSDAIQKLIRKDDSAYKSVCDYLKYSGVEDFDCEDDFNISYLLSKLMYYEAVDGEDYWDFDGFEIFPEYELDESIRRNRSIKEYIDNSEDIYDLEGCFDELKRMERSKKNMTKEQYNLFTAAYNAISNWRYSNGSEKDVFHSCYKFAEYCKNNPGRLTIQQMQLVDYIHERT